MIFDRLTSQINEQKTSRLTKQAGRRLVLGAFAGGLLTGCGVKQIGVDLVRHEPVIDSSDIINYPHPLYSPEATVVRLIQLGLQPQFQGLFGEHSSGRVTKQQVEAVRQNSFREKGFEVTNSELERRRFVYLQQNPTYNGPLDNKNWPSKNISSVRYSLTLDQDQVWSNFDLSGFAPLDRIPTIQNKVQKIAGPFGSISYDVLPATLCDAAFIIGVLPSQTEQIMVPTGPGSTGHCDITGKIGLVEKPVTVKFSMYQSGSWRLQLTGSNYIPRP
jgi:hypothetical protein